MNNKVFVLMKLNLHFFGYRTSAWAYNFTHKMKVDPIMLWSNVFLGYSSGHCDHLHFLHGLRSHGWCNHVETGLRSGWRGTLQRRRAIARQQLLQRHSQGLLRLCRSKLHLRLCRQPADDGDYFRVGPANLRWLLRRHHLLGHRFARRCPQSFSGQWTARNCFIKSVCPIILAHLN